MVGGALVLATASIVGSVAVVGAGPAAAAGTITQNAPVKGSVAYGTPFSDQLQTSGNLGPVTFVTDSATTWGTVSSTGAVSAPGTTPPGTYLLFGTDADAFSDTGQWRYTLTVINDGPPITQTAPTSGSVTTSGSAAFTDHLRTTGNTGPVTFTKTGGTADLKVSSGGEITTTGTLAAGSYTATGTVADAFGDAGTFAYTLTVKAVTIIQSAPTTGAVTTTGSAAFTDHLNTTGNIGKRSFVKTGGGTGLKVSFGGKITTTGTLAKGTYKATGTVADHFGDTGTFTYTLTVKAVTITQTAPTQGSLTYGNAFSDQLQTSGNIGPVTFATDSATTWGTVSSTGAVSTPGTNPPGTYLLFGTDADAFGDTGDWRYILTCCRPPIFQTQPISGSVTTSGSAAFTDHLMTTNNAGPVTFTKTGGTAGLKVSSGGKITTTGTLAAGSYTATGTVADAFGGAGVFSYTLTVRAVTIIQTAPTTGAVTTTGSAAFTDHLNTTGNIGKRRFVKTRGGAALTVSYGGMITTTGTLAKGTYKANGTVADHFGDTGTFTYTLTVKAVPIQSAPTSGSVTELESSTFTDQLNATGGIGAVTFTGGGTGLTVSSTGQITTTGTLVSGTYTATGTMSDAFGDTGAWVYTLTVDPSFPWTEPTSGSVTVAGSAAFTVQLRTAGYFGPVIFTKTGGGTGIKVSSGGKITTTGTLAEGIYTATGTTSDAFGDTGTFTYTLTVTSVSPSP
jgi:hypothetical protein